MQKTSVAVDIPLSWSVEGYHRTPISELPHRAPFSHFVASPGLGSLDPVTSPFDPVWSIWIGVELSAPNDIAMPWV